MKPSFVRPLALLTPLVLAAVTSGTAAAQWNATGTTLWTSDLVGIGTPTPSYRLHVVENTLTPALKSDSGAYLGTAVWGTASGSGGVGVLGHASSTSGNTVGVKGHVSSPAGKAVWGYVAGTSGASYAVYGQNASPQGYSGFFTGGNFYYGGGFMGVGRTWQVNSTEALGIHKNSTSWGGMYMSTEGGGKPYYGYATAGAARAYHYYDSGSNQWRLNCGGERLAVNASNGRVGINTVSPKYKLHVNGSAGKPGGGSWSNASDRRLKKDIVSLDGALQQLLSVRGVSYEYIDAKAIGELPGRQIGVIAQEVEEVFPGWVDEADDGYKRVTFRGFEGVAIEALRELDEQNGRLRSEVTDVRTENQRLADELAGMSARLEKLEEVLEAAVRVEGSGR